MAHGALVGANAGDAPAFWWDVDNGTKEESWIVAFPDLVLVSRIGMPGTLAFTGRGSDLALAQGALVEGKADCDEAEVVAFAHGAAVITGALILALDDVGADIELGAGV